MQADRPSPIQIRQSLERLVVEPELARSPQLVEFLKYVVEQTLSGGASRLKAYSIATDVFGRGADFDPQTDASVRVQAGRLRKALDAIYRRGVTDVAVRIELPVGRYVPRFALIDSATSGPVVSKRFEKTPAHDSALDAGRDEHAQIWPLGSAALVVVAIVLAMLVFWAAPTLIVSGEVEERSDRPVIIVSGFEAEDGATISDVRILQAMLIERLSAFDTLDVLISTPSIEKVGPTGNLVYRLGGTLHQTGNDIEFRAVVTRESSSEVVWSHGLFREGTGLSPADTLRFVADRVAAGIGAARGEVQADARRLLPESRFSGANASEFACRLLFREALGPGRVAESEAARRCYLGRLSADTSDILALSVIGVLDAFGLMRSARPAENLAEQLQVQAATAADAVRANPTSSFAHELYAYIFMATADIDGARRQFHMALENNTGSADVEASLGIMLSLAGVHSGQSHIERAITLTPWPAGWYYSVRALTSLRHGDYASAVRYALTLLPDDPELGMAVLVAAAPGAARADLVAANVPALLGREQFQRQGIIPRLSVRVPDQRLIEVLQIGLIRAGITQDQLDGSYVY